jgi:hypothetical protein
MHAEDLKRGLAHHHQGADRQWLEKGLKSDRQGRDRGKINHPSQSKTPLVQQNGESSDSDNSSYLSIPQSQEE